MKQVTEKTRWQTPCLFCSYILGASIPAAAHSSLRGRIRQELLSQLAALKLSFVHGDDFDD